MRNAISWEQVWLTLLLVFHILASQDILFDILLGGTASRPNRLIPRIAAGPGLVTGAVE